MEPDEFRGRIGRDWRDSEPWWPDPERAPADAPNVVLVVLDDVGFAQFGCYGSDIDTPTFNRLAAGGLRYTSFHTTALCSPTRACLMTGRNHHSVGMGRITDLARGYPGYSGRIPKSCGFVSETLREHGYATFADRQVAPHARRRHAPRRGTRPLAARARLRALLRLLRRRDAPVLARARARQPLRRGTGRLRRRLPPHRGPRRPRDRLHHRSPCGRPGEAVLPLLLHRRVPLTAPGAARDGSSGTGAGSTWVGTGGARRSTRASSTRASSRPEPSCRRGPTGSRPGTRSPTTSSAVSARFMECFAAYLSHADAQIGRVVSYLEEIGELDNTLIVVVSDNGASSEGGATGSINDLRTWNAHPAGMREMVESHRRARRSDDAQQLPVGLDDGRQHAVAPLEARGARRRRRRPVHRALPVAHRRAR